MANPIRFIVLTATLMAVGLALRAQQITLRAGALIHCTLYELSFSSRTAQIGEPVICHTYPLREFGYSVFPRGSYLTGRFVDYKDPGRLAGKGWTKLERNRLIPPSHKGGSCRSKGGVSSRFQDGCRTQDPWPRPPQARPVLLDHPHPLAVPENEAGTL